MSILINLVFVLSTVQALGLAAFVLSRNWRASSNRWLAIALLAVSAHQGLFLAAGTLGYLDRGATLVRVALGVLPIVPPSWLAFCLALQKGDDPAQVRRWRLIALGMTALLPLAWLGLGLGYVVGPILAGNPPVILLRLDLWGKMYFSAYVVALASLLVRFENLYRQAVPGIRHKLRFLVVGVFFAFGFQIVFSSLCLLYGVLHPMGPGLSAAAFLLAQTMIAFTLVRHRLLSTDVFVSRYIIYRSITFGLIGGYLIFLGLASEALLYLGARLDLLSGLFLAVLGAAALALMLLSERLQSNVKDFIRTHFYKHKYDYRKEWMEFTRRLSRAIAVPEIAAGTVNRILEVMWVRQAAMYAARPGNGQMGLVHQVEYASLPPLLEFPGPLLEGLREQAALLPSASDPKTLSDVTVALIREKFGTIPIGCVVPVAARDTVVGLLVVGPELSGRPFGVDDYDLLAAVAAQAGALMVNARLSQEASEGRELQVLARVSAFVAHDLKNAVSMLSMLAENATHHMAKPEFQADAVRTLNEVSARMRRLLAVMTSSGARGGVQLRMIALVPSIEAWMREIGTQIPSRIRVDTRLDGAVEVRVDADQLRSVLHNLVLNAVEAIPGEGTILVETKRENGCAILLITDSGQGMTREFMEQKLFRPFQTTKAQGLGLGLYQCRYVVQGFGGTLTAESREGTGTRMIVRLPCEAVSLEKPALSYSS